MKKPTVSYSKGEIGRVKVIEDFLPSPDALILHEDNVKVTLSLSQRSVDYFKRAARQRRVPYQRMIRALVNVLCGEAGREGVNNLIVRYLATASSDAGRRPRGRL